MKNIYYIILLGMAVLATACSKGEKVCCDVLTEPELPEFYIYGRKADTVWLGQPYFANLSNRGALYVETKSPAERLVFNIEDFKGTGSYRLAGTNCLFYNEAGYDYIADTSPNNTFEVKEYDVTTGIISGTLAVSMKLRYTGVPDNIVRDFYFARGQFRLQIER